MSTTPICGAYYGAAVDDSSHPNTKGVVCVRAEGHPPYSTDYTGHSDLPRHAPLDLNLDPAIEADRIRALFPWWDDKAVEVYAHAVVAYHEALMNLGPIAS